MAVGADRLPSLVNLVTVVTKPAAEIAAGKLVVLPVTALPASVASFPVNGLAQCRLACYHYVLIWLVPGVCSIQSAVEIEETEAT